MSLPTLFHSRRSIWPSFLIIPLAVFVFSLIGSVATEFGMPWYNSLALPSWTPPGMVIGLAWTIIYALTAVSIWITWNLVPHRRPFWTIMTLFVINGFLNIGWSILFFGFHLIAIALIEMVLLEVTVIALIALLWNRSRTAAVLLIPYGLWVAFATILTIAVWSLN